MIRNVLSHILLYYQPGKFKDIKQFLFSAENFREDLFYSENENQTASQLSGPGKSSFSTFSSRFCRDREGDRRSNMQAVTLENKLE